MRVDGGLSILRRRLSSLLQWCDMLVVSFTSPFLTRCRAEGFTMANGDSVTHWLDGLKAGDDDEIQRLWDRYFQRLVRLAGTRLPGHARRAIDEEDVALSAFQSFCDRARKGQFPGSGQSRRSLACALRDHGPQGHRRGAAPDPPEAGRGSCAGRVGAGRRTTGSPDGGLAAFLSREPTPDDAAEFADQLDTLFERLNDETLRVIAFQKLQGLTSEEIAASLGISTRTVDRKLQLIRAIWAEESRNASPADARPRTAGRRSAADRRRMRSIRSCLADRRAART